MKRTKRGLHHHVRLTAQVTTVIASVSLLGCLALFMWVKWWLIPNHSLTTTTPTNTAQSVTTPPVTPVSPSTYREDINRLIGTFGFDDAAQAETLSYQVIDLRVPPELLQFQLQLVVALNDAQHGKFTQAQAAVTLLRQQYAWFTP